MDKLRSGWQPKSPGPPHPTKKTETGIDDEEKWPMSFESQIGLPCRNDTRGCYHEVNARRHLCSLVTGRASLRQSVRWRGHRRAPADYLPEAEAESARFSSTLSAWATRVRGSSFFSASMRCRL